MDVVTYTAAPSTTRLYGRAVGGSLPRLRGSGRPADRLPDLQVRRLGVRTDLDQLATYVRITDGLLADRLPALFPHLAAFGPQLALLTDRRFGFAAMGLVHVQHRLTQHRPLLVGETYDLAVSPAGLRTHRRGQLIDIQTDATVHGETVWQETMSCSPEVSPAATSWTAHRLTGWMPQRAQCGGRCPRTPGAPTRQSPETATRST